MKFADDTYLVIPAANVQSCAAEIAQVESWAAENNLSLNRSLFCRGVTCSDHTAAVSAWFCACWIHQSSRCHHQPSFLCHWTCWQSTKILCANTVCNAFHGITGCRLTLCMQSSMQQLLPNCHTLLHAAWWGYANADDEARLEALLRRSSKLGFRADTAPTLASSKHMCWRWKQAVQKRSV